MSEPTAVPEKIRVVLDHVQILAIIDALRSNGNVDLALHLEASLRKSHLRKSQRGPRVPWAH